MIRRPPRSTRTDTLFPYTTLFRSSECWRLADRIMLALTPKDKSLQDCKIAVQRLKYQRSSGDFDRLAAMTGNALGRWGRLGAAIDVCRSKPAGPFRRNGLSDRSAKRRGGKECVSTGRPGWVPFHN